VCRVVALHIVFSRASSALAVCCSARSRSTVLVHPSPSRPTMKARPSISCASSGRTCSSGALRMPSPRRELPNSFCPSSTTHHLHLHQRWREGDKGVGLGQTARQGGKQLAVFIQRKYAYSAPTLSCRKLCSLCVWVP
jgi:hypothetical protein